MNVTIKISICFTNLSSPSLCPFSHPPVLSGLIDIVPPWDRNLESGFIVHLKGAEPLKAMKLHWFTGPFCSFLHNLSAWKNNVWWIHLCLVNQKCSPFLWQLMKILKNYYFLVLATPPTRKIHRSISLSNLK